jgi:hypothetical protein
MDDRTWTPYGLEAIRVSHLRRRRAALLALLFFAGLVWLVFAPAPTTQNEVQIFANGDRVGGANGLTIDAPEKEKPVTVAIEPGKITHASAGSAPTSERIDRASSAVPTIPRAIPIPYVANAIKFGPFALLALAIWFLGKRKAGTEVNYGVYKGAMPLELITASASRRILTGRKAKASVFGKERADHLPPEARLPQERDA